MCCNYFMIHIHEIRKKLLKFKKRNLGGANFTLKEI